MKRPLVSIITPTYNHEKFIKQCIESVISQTHTDWEHIIIDDGSTDKTGEIASSYKDPRIKYIRQGHIGIWNLDKTYNKALAISKGDYIAILEGDDMWPKNKLEIQINAIKETDAILCWGRANIIDNNGKKLDTCPRIDFSKPSEVLLHCNKPVGSILSILLYENPIPSSTMVTSKRALQEIGGFHRPCYIPHVDYPTLLLLALKGEFCLVREIVGLWRFHEKQTSLRLTPYILLGARLFAKKFYEKIPDEIKAQLDVKLDDLAVNKADYVARSYFFIGRLNLIKRNWLLARGNFFRSLRMGGLLTKLISIFAIVLCVFKENIELLRKMGLKFKRI
jgi:glycosyltransferase involved in cell wall biosynthesis